MESNSHRLQLSRLARIKVSVHYAGLGVQGSSCSMGSQAVQLRSAAQLRLRSPIRLASTGRMLAVSTNYNKRVVTDRPECMLSEPVYGRCALATGSPRDCHGVTVSHRRQSLLIDTFCPSVWTQVMMLVTTGNVSKLYAGSLPTAGNAETLECRHCNCVAASRTEARAQRTVFEVDLKLPGPTRCWRPCYKYVNERCNRKNMDLQLIDTSLQVQG